MRTDNSVRTPSFMEKIWMQMGKSRWTILRGEILSALDNERDNLKAYDYESYDESNCCGWVEALECVLGKMARIEGDEEE